MAGRRRIGESMRRGPESGLLGAEEVGRLVGGKETTVRRRRKEGKRPCPKAGQRWRIRLEALEDFLKRSEHPVTLAGQLGSFLREPDSVLAIAQHIDTSYPPAAPSPRGGA